MAVIKKLRKKDYEKLQFQKIPGWVYESGIKLTIEHPLSLNTIFKSFLKQGSVTDEVKIMRAKTGRYKDYNNQALSDIASQLIELGISGIQLNELVNVEITLYTDVTKTRNGDIDNYIKPVLDLVTRSGLWRDDCLVTDLRIKRNYVQGKSFAEMLIKPIQSGQSLQ